MPRKSLIVFSDGIIANFSRQYIDTRTQANLSKLNVNKKQELDIVTEEMSNILERRRRISGKLFPRQRQRDDMQNVVVIENKIKI